MQTSYWMGKAIAGGAARIERERTGWAFLDNAGFRHFGQVDDFGNLFVPNPPARRPAVLRKHAEAL